VAESPIRSIAAGQTFTPIDVPGAAATGINDRGLTIGRPPTQQTELAWSGAAPFQDLAVTRPGLE
jgi:hypothetical protein